MILSLLGNVINFQLNFCLAVNSDICYHLEIISKTNLRILLDRAQQGVIKHCIQNRPKYTSLDCARDNATFNRKAVGHFNLLCTI